MRWATTTRSLPTGCPVRRRPTRSHAHRAFSGHAAHRTLTRQPLEILEIGASASLNLSFDAYRYDLGQGLSWGRPTPRSPSTPNGAASRHRSTLRFESLHVRAATSIRSIQANLRTAPGFSPMCGQIRPIDCGAPRPRSIGRRPDRKIEKADAVEWVAAKLAEPQEAGTTRVLFHTIVWDYLPAPSKARIDALVAAAAARATGERPLRA